MHDRVWWVLLICPMPNLCVVTEPCAMTLLFNIVNDALLRFLAQAVVTYFKQIDRVDLKQGFGCRIMHYAAAVRATCVMYCQWNHHLRDI